MIFIPDDIINDTDTLFLDRDGVINILRPADYVKCWEEFRFCDGILANLAEWAKHYRHIIIVTNQRGVGKGLMTMQDLEDIHSCMLAEIEKTGGRIDRIYVCTAIDSTDPMRKPSPGMVRQALRDFPDINLTHSVMIGDMPSDAEFARNAGIRYTLILPQKQ